jgi:hypothetical protein
MRKLLGSTPMRKTLLLTTAVGLLTFSTAANAALFIANGSNQDGALLGAANITVSNGSLTVVLVDTATGQISSGQTISDVSFNISGLGTASNFTQAGTLVNVSNATTPNFIPIVGSPDHWISQVAGDAVHFTTLSGGQPRDLIVGGFPAPNGGFDNFNPYINGGATFTLACTGCSNTDTISGVQISFGTNGFNVVATPAIPEISTWAMLLLGLAGVGLFGMPRRGGSPAIRII